MIFSTALAVVISGQTVFQREKVICKAAVLLFKLRGEFACFP